ncbi:long-chain fatty acid--CoA ligase [Vibrio galatheae]|uniref:Long-chain fatty acid--CoA ligase n=1 Tax=Vibrio galatheae TaxID=579748 RepID=A0A0F4NIC2_9VIBR|nr:AMP-binding protein [Vibrio galatheae]KJY82880.1 long-chain fatty acid--CoA ligase [Vibrio galatheae]
MNAILNAIEKWARETPDNIAFVGSGLSGEPLPVTYKELVDCIHYTAHQLQAMQAQAIALRADNSLGWVVVDLAAMYLNVVVVPIPTFFSASQVEHILHSSAVDALVGEWSVNEGDYVGERIETIAGLAVYAHNMAQSASYLPGTQKITFTSGSTGAPKGVCLSQDNVCRVAQSLATSVCGEATRHLIVLPLSTLLENITGVYVPLLLGVTSYVVSGEQTGLMGSNQFDVKRFANALEQYHPQSLVLTPALLLALISVVKQQPSLAETLKYVAVGGARVSASLIEAAQQLGIAAYEGYGLSECGSVVCLNTPKAHKAGSSGRVLPHLNVRIAKDGELEVKGNSALGYLGAAFTSEWLATGDLAEIDAQGFVTLLGRKKNLIVTAYGRNVSPEWVESEAVAFLPNVPFFVIGNDQHTLCAITQQQPDLAQKVTALNALLPDYARIGRLLVFENISQVTQWFTANGKIRRNQLERDATQLLANNQVEMLLDGQSVTRIDIAAQQLLAS